ncbi:esterase/lipase family protein [Pseudonocardia thermophila]|jgi:Lysophospholipase|uniref:esterase/lipase family protein n=1 Tax=Pseudonocardia thermophila TaxID=1848 RepID=UPI00248EB243|nr:alpha/beta hydrolase [Pseudonocardia thermophila]
MRRRLVLVHGAWHGAWAWAPVADLLRAAGHEVVALDLPGADGDPAVSLSDQARAVCEALAPGSLLVAHSHGGLVAQEAAAAVPDRVAGVIGIDAWFAVEPASFLDLVPTRMAELISTSAADQPAVPVPPPAVFGIDDPQLAAAVTPRLRPQPVRTFTDVAAGFRFADAGIPGIGIVCEPRTLPFAELAEAQGFPVRAITAGHDAMLLRPPQLAAMLIAAAVDLHHG